MENLEKNRVEIRCPQYKKNVKTNELYKCNRICVKVIPGSAGEARCRSCHLSFEFEVDSQAQMTTGVRVKKVDSEELSD